MRFPYLPHRVGTEWVYRPVLTVIVWSESFRAPALRYRCLIDSGADRCLFPVELLSVLGLLRVAGEPREIVGVAGAPLRCYLHGMKYTVAGQTIRIQALFAEGLRLPYGLLGQQGFFDQFTVTMTNQPLNRYIELERRPSSGKARR